MSEAFADAADPDDSIGRVQISWNRLACIQLIPCATLMNKTQSAKSKSAAIVRMDIGPDNERNFMKKLMATLTILAVVAGGTQTASAGDREWAAAGEVLTGVVARAVSARTIELSAVCA